MLNYQDFESIENYTPYDFNLLDPFKKQRSYTVYQSLENNKLVKVVSTKNLEFLQYLHVLQEFDLIDGPLGYLKKGTQFYIFMQVHQQITLFQSIQLRKKQINKPYFKECQTFELIKLVVSLINILIQKKIGFSLHVLTPNDFIITNFQSISKIKLKFPLQEPIYNNNGIIHEYLRQRREFCAPELIDRSSSINNKSQKPVIYSLGLIILFSIFGETPKRIVKIQPSQNDIQFLNQFKFKRNQIKVFYDSKTIPKILKILLQKREKYRDGIKTLELKLLSPIFLEAEKPVIEDEPQDEIIEEDLLIGHQTTRSFDFGDMIVPLQTKKTIEFQIMLNTRSIHTLNNSSYQVSNHETFKESKLTINCLSVLDAEAIDAPREQHSKVNLLDLSNKYEKTLLQTVITSPRYMEDRSVFFKTNNDNILLCSQDVLALNQTISETKQRINKNRRRQARFSGSVQQFRKFKLVSYLLFGLVVLLIGLCLLYLSLFSEE